jgi:hypothetical protein
MADVSTMPKLTMGRRIEAEAIKILTDKDYADGIKASDLKAKIASQHPSIPPGTIAQYISDFATKGDKIRRLQRGVIALAESMAPQSVTPFDTGVAQSTVEQKADATKEATFYEPFSKWLVNEAQEVTEAVAIGGGSLRGKWGTPDVIGVYKSRPSDLIKFPAEIVSVEIKTDPAAAITAFGQAISYRLFSHKTLIAMADTIEKSEDANSRLKSLCHLFGVGYVVFDKDNVESPNFRLIVPPRRFDPDMDYVNEFATRLLAINKSYFNKLFG